ncbi:hypothetical protein BMS3Bbin11_00134 [bacterium BMS3Bbin11]|nr:hypothetical protein BMS3Bbin11_00134 [bacterium BMS3Bbin11]
MFNQLDLVVFLLQCLSEPEADVACAGKHDGMYRFVQLTHFTHHGTDVFCCSNEKDFIILFNHSVTIRHDCLTLSVDGNNSRFDTG